MAGPISSNGFESQQRPRTRNEMRGLRRRSLTAERRRLALVAAAPASGSRRYVVVNVSLAPTAMTSTSTPCNYTTSLIATSACSPD